MNMSKHITFMDVLIATYLALFKKNQGLWHPSAADTPGYDCKQCVLIAKPSDFARHLE